MKTNPYPAFDERRVIYSTSISERYEEYANQIKEKHSHKLPRSVNTPPPVQYRFTARIENDRDGVPVQGDRTLEAINAVATVFICLPLAPLLLFAGAYALAKLVYQKLTSHDLRCN